MRCLLYQTANDRLHNVGVGISAFIWRTPETESGLASGPGDPFRVYVDKQDGRHREVMTWGFAPAWVGREGLKLLGQAPWPWLSLDRAASSRAFAHPLRYQRCLVPADALYVGTTGGAWLSGPHAKPMFLAGVWDDGTFALLTAETSPHLFGSVGPRMPIALGADHFNQWLSPETKCLESLRRTVAHRRNDWSPATETPAVALAYASYLHPATLTRTS